MSYKAHRKPTADPEALELRNRSLPSSTFQKTYRDDPVAFLHDAFAWRKDEGAAFYQEEIAAQLVANKREAVRGPHGLGKTALASWIILWFALTRDGEDWKIATTASAWRQLTKFLWPEIHKWARRLKRDVIGREPFDPRRELLQLSLKLATGEAFAVASDDPTLIEGAHADHLLYVFDESKSIKAETFDAAEGAFSNAGQEAANEAFALSISTPGEPQGRFYDIHSKRPGYEDWNTRHVTLDETIRAHRVTPDWADQRKRQWGEASAVYQNRVLGEFAASDEEGIVPLAWIEAANARWEEWVEANKPGVLQKVGADIARSGSAKTVFALNFDVRGVEKAPCKHAIDELRRYSKEDTMQTSGRLTGILSARPARAIVDVIGIGAGVVDRVREQGYEVVAFNASAKTNERDKTNELGFVNMRSYGWWTVREMLDPANDEQVALPPDDQLTGDLTAPHWRVMSGGRIQIESKDDIIKRLGRSTDDGDAVMMSLVNVALEVEAMENPFYN